MSVEIKIECRPEGDAAHTIRTLFCQEAGMEQKGLRNPLMDTNFNKLLDEIAQTAFNEGITFKYPES